MTLDSYSGNGRHDWRWRLLAGALAALAVVVAQSVLSRGSGAATVDANLQLTRSFAPREANGRARGAGPRTPSAPTGKMLASLPESLPVSARMRLRFSRTLASMPSVRAETRTAATEQESASEAEPMPVLSDHLMTVRSGDSLSRMFKAEGLSQKDLKAIMAAGKPVAKLSRLRPGDRITVYTDVDNRVQGLSYQRGAKTRLEVARDGDTFKTGVSARPANAVMIARIGDNSNDWVELHKPPPRFKRHSITVSNGDSLYSIFKSNGIELAELQTIVRASKETRQLTRLVPGQRLEFQLTPDNRVSRLIHYLDDTQSLHVRRNGVGFDSKFVDVPLDRHMNSATGTIEDSLFLAGQRAGLSDRIIMQMVEIFGWDVDFALDIRAGDRFSVIYDELYKDGEKLKDGNILAAVFTNQGKTTRIVRYEYSDGGSAYFTPEGVSIRKAFLRTPVNYSRISSGFNLRRKHPILHKFRAHRGVDYAAARGTPIKATGDGKIEYIGWKGGYGKTIVLRHGSTYTTLYAHMKRFARGLRRGKRVTQGQIIGYVGSTGLATGPHLHYEFRVRGVHRNPLRVKLPTAAPIAAEYKQDFLASTRDVIARLDMVSNPTLAADERRLTNAD